MKIAICIRSWKEHGGIGVYTRNLVRKLAQLDDRNEYLLFHNSPECEPLFPQARNFRPVFVPAPGKLLWDHYAIPRMAAKENADVIFHTKLTVPLLTRRKCVMVLHGTERFYFPDFHPKSDRLYFRTIYPLFFKKAAKIIAVSERTRSDIMQLMHLAEDKVAKVYMAPDQVFHVVHDRNALEDVRKKYDLPQRFIVFVGHIYPGKNIGRLFEAFAKVRAKYDVKLVIAGGYRWKYQREMDMIRQLGIACDVKLAGHVPPEDLVAFYNLAELTLFPSFYESFGLTNVEANACGCPLVTSKTGGSPEAAGDAALYVDPLSVDDIANKVDRLLSDPVLRKELREKGLRNVQRFSWERTAQETILLIESLSCDTVSQKNLKVAIKPSFITGK